MQNDENLIIKKDWKFQKDYFKKLSKHARELSHYELVVHKLF